MCGCVMWLIRVCDIANSQVWDASFLRGTWHTHMFVACLCDMAHSYAWLCDVAHSYVWLRYVASWRIRMCDIANLQVWDALFFRGRGVPICSLCVCVTWRIHMCNMLHS